MTDDAKCYAATPAKTLEQHIMDPNIAKNEAEWWAHHEIEKLRAALRTFADIAESLPHRSNTVTASVLMSDLRAAKAALKETGE